MFRLLPVGIEPGAVTLFIQNLLGIEMLIVSERTQIQRLFHGFPGFRIHFLHDEGTGRLI